MGESVYVVALNGGMLRRQLDSPDKPLALLKEFRHLIGRERRLPSDEAPRPNGFRTTIRPPSWREGSDTRPK